MSIYEMSWRVMQETYAYEYMMWDIMNQYNKKYPNYQAKWNNLYVDMKLKDNHIYKVMDKIFDKLSSLDAR